jgi:hypothetical protein
MEAYEKKTGGSVLAIAHNGNLSNGRMFPVVEAFGKMLDRPYVETRAKWERLYEATQTKGDGETHPVLSPNDEFANFERWDFGNLDASEAKKPEMLEFEYARSALKIPRSNGRLVPTPTSSDGRSSEGVIPALRPWRRTISVDHPQERSPSRHRNVC